MLDENDPKKLIKSFSCEYANRLIVFARSKHVFDHMITAENEIESNRSFYAGINYSFVDFTDCLYIQLSDVVAGITAKCAMFANQLTYTEIQIKLSNLNKKTERLPEAIKKMYGLVI